MEKDRHLRLDINDRTAPQDPSDVPVPGRIRFFAARSFGASTWFVSLVLVLQVAAFAITMFVNNCPNGPAPDSCTVKSLGRFSFQPISQNPLLGPSASTLIRMGALQRASSVAGRREHWRLVAFPWLNAGAIQLGFNFFGILLFAIRLEQDYGALRIGTIYLVSGFTGGLASAVFARELPAVGASGGLFGLLGALLSGLIQNWQIYDDKLSTLAVLGVIAAANFTLGLLPYADNFANLAAFPPGILLGFVFFFNPQLGQMERRKGLYDHSLNSTMKLRQKLDRPLRRVLSMVLSGAILAGGIAAVLAGVDANRYCGWCRYIDCIPSKIWSCE